MRYGYFDDDRREYVITRPDPSLPSINHLRDENGGEFGSPPRNARPSTSPRWGTRFSLMQHTNASTLRTAAVGNEVRRTARCAPSRIFMGFFLLFLASLALCLTTATLRAQPGFHHFITARADQLIDGDEPFRFISWNIPNLLMIEDNVPFSGTNPWRLPDRFELNDALSTVREMGGTVARTYVVTVRRSNDTPDMPRHVLGPGRFDDEAFRALDLALQVADEQGVRVIIPLVDNWSWQGGRAEYAGFRGKSKDDFWTDPQLIEDFKRTIHFILTRTNTLTGVRYRDDKAILCWETGNELQSPVSWTRDIAAYIKSLDPHHLVMDGYHASRLREESLLMPEVDIVTTHHYPGGETSFDELIRENWSKARDRKPYVVGEFGFVPTSRIQTAIGAIRDTGTAGGLLWSLRFRNRDGGFYWHSEPAGGNLYKAFHWPGSSIGDAYDEVPLMAMVRQSAYQIRGITPPPLPVPHPPTMLPVPDAGAITWRGSVGATGYAVERAPGPNGPWMTAAEKVDEAFVQYRPLFADESVPRGNWYYRVRAWNASGTSDPSNIVGPVEVARGVLVDELAGWERVHFRSGDWEIRSRDCRQAKEDAHRPLPDPGATLTYQLSTAITGFRVFAFFPSETTDLKISVSGADDTLQEIRVGKRVYFEGTGDYGYWRPVEYCANDVPPESHLLRIELTGETRIGRVEIYHVLAP